MSWTLSDLRETNQKRQIEWCAGQSPGKDDLSFRSMELGGEVGEALNVAKKIVRERNGWAGSRATIQDLADELADVIICADLVAMAENIDPDGRGQEEIQRDL
jgi:NTP pyrophosphatase (non-canonical NTP hydrolase)